MNLLTQNSVKHQYFFPTLDSKIHQCGNLLTAFKACTLQHATTQNEHESTRTHTQISVHVKKQEIEKSHTCLVKQQQHKAQGT